MLQLHNTHTPNINYIDNFKLQVNSICIFSVREARIISVDLRQMINLKSFIASLSKLKNV